MVIDADGHLFEGRDMWSRYCTAAERDLALRVEDDALGYPWLMLGDRSLERIAWVTVPGHFEYMGQVAAAWRDQQPYPGISYDDLPLDYFNPVERLATAKTWGVDEVVLFPQANLLWDRYVGVDLEAARVNMGAWNRWAAEIAQAGNGRIHPVGHLSFEGGLEWGLGQLAELAAGGVKLVMFPPLQIDGKRLSHPDHEIIWTTLVDNGMSIAWHTQSELRALLAETEGWTDNDMWASTKVVTGLFQRVAPQVALCDLAANGVLARHPDLRISMAELGSEWFPQLLRRIDTQYDIHRNMHGAPLSPELTMAPSEYILRQSTLICSVLGDFDRDLLAKYPGTLAFGGDYPHPEGLDDTLRSYQDVVGPLDDQLAAKFYSGNATALIHG